jgi:hypothetical protein
MVRALLPLLVVVVLVGGVGGAARSRACDQIGSLPIAFASFPADGAVGVPLNVTPLVPGTDEFQGPITGHELRGPDGPVAIGSIAVDVVGEIATTMLQLVPAAPLSPATTYTLVDTRGGVATFTTGTAVDDDVPAAPAVVVGAVTAPDPDRTGFGCGVRGRAALTVDVPDGHTAIVARDSDPLLSAVLADVDVDGDLVVFADADFEARVALLDLAGHVSLPTRVDVALPAPAGCTSAGGGAGANALVFLALLRRARRRRRSG